MHFLRSSRKRTPGHHNEPLTQISPGRKPEVWLLNQYAISTDLPGITRHVELARQLEMRGWNTRVFAAAFHHTTATLQRNVTWRRLAVHDISDDVAFTWLYSSQYRANGLRRYINMVTFTASLVAVGQRQSPPDVIVGSSPHLLTGLGGWLLARRFGIPFVFEVRDVWPDMLVQLGLTSRFVIGPLSWLERFLYRRADRIIALTDGIADRIAAKGVSPDKIVVISNATLHPSPVDAGERDDQRERLGWKDKTVLVWAGSHNPMNGLDVVVESARMMCYRDDILFAFIGDGSLKDQLVQQAHGLSNVAFYDPVPKTEIACWLRAADIGLLHSRRFEVFTGARPNKLFDYMAAGLPIISTVPGEAWRLVEEAGAGIEAEWENPASLASAVKILADDRVTRSAMGQRAFRAVSEGHSRESTGEQLAILLANVCRLHGDGPSPTEFVYRSDVIGPETGASHMTTALEGEKHVHAAD